MLPTTNAPRPGNRFRSARNKSVISKASDMVSSTFAWSTRNAKNKGAAYEAYKKNDSSNGSITIDTSYLSNNIGFADSYPSKSKNTWHKLKKQANRKFLDQPWLLPTIIGSSFLSAILIIFFTVFSNSSTHGEVAAGIESSNLNAAPSSFANQDYGDHRAHRTMRKKYNRGAQNAHTHNSYGANKKPSQPQKQQTQQRPPVQSETAPRFSLEKSIDYVFGLFHNNDANRWNAVSSLTNKYCISETHFSLENSEAIDNLRGNIGTLVFDIVKMNPIYTDVTPQNAVISSKGTFIPSTSAGNKYSRSSTTHCDLVTHLFQLADDLGMLNPTTKEMHDFDIEPEQFFDEHKSDINHKTINQDVAVLFDHAEANEFYEISMELPRLVEKHCSHTNVWIRNQGEQAEDNFYNSLSRAIFTVNSAETSELSDNVIGFPVIDNNGDLMQLESGILTFDKNDLESHKNLHYSRCELLDKIVFHGLTMSMNKHIDFMYDAASKDDFYGFEILADLLDTEYCSIIDTKLSQSARNNLGLHLWSLTKDIIGGQFHITSDIDDESNQYIITSDGGIMHSKVAKEEMKLKKSQMIHCGMVKEIIKRGIKYHSGNADYYHSTEDYDTDSFEHRYDDSGLSQDFMNEMNGEHTMADTKQLKIDASNLITHLKNGDETEFVKLLDYLLEQYHSQWFGKIAASSDYHNKRSVKLMIEQTLHSVILGSVNLSSQYDPNNDLTILRKDVNELEVVHKDDFKTLPKETIDNLERLPLLDEVFKQMMQNQ